jgi:Flp pilus assembly pilin Flp
VSLLVCREDGQGLVEYGLIMFMVLLVVLAIVVVFHEQMAVMYSAITASL